MTERLRVLVADDHPMYRSGLRAVLDDDPDIEVVGEAGDGGETVDLAADLQPDIVIMDLQMPEMSGIEATRRITAVNPHTAVVVLTMFDRDESVFAAVQAGARGYVLKGAGQEEILRAVHAVANGEAIFGPQVARRILTQFAAQQNPLPLASCQLTDREREVLALLAQGRSNQQIARVLQLSDKTVRNNVSNILTKLQVADRAQAIVRAREAGLGLPGPEGPAAFESGR